MLKKHEASLNAFKILRVEKKENKPSASVNLRKAKKSLNAC